VDVIALTVKKVIRDLKSNSNFRGKDKGAMIISDHFKEIVPPQELLKRLLAYAKIDIIMAPDPDKYHIRIYHYDKDWLKNGHFFKIDDSGGDHYYVMFSSDGCIIKGFDHECELSPYIFDDEDEPLPDDIAGHNFYEGAPAELLSLVSDPALEKELVTFCTWQSADDTEWHFAPTTFPKDWDDGIKTFLFYTHGLESYCKWFEDEYYESPLATEILQKIFDGNKITSDIIKTLHPEATPKKILKDLKKYFSDCV
jgi:hypothetical protein